MQQQQAGTVITPHRIPIETEMLLIRQELPIQQEAAVMRPEQDAEIQIQHPEQQIATRIIILETWKTMIIINKKVPSSEGTFLCAKIEG